MTAGPSDSLRNATEQGESPAFVPANPAEQRTRDDIVRVLSDFQTGLEAVKNLHAQRESLQIEILQRKTELAERDALLEAQKREFEAAVAKFEGQVKELESAREEHIRREQALQERTRELETRAAALEKDAVEHAQLIAAADEELSKSGTILESRARELASLADKLERQGKELADARAQLSTREADAARLRAELDLSVASARRTQQKSTDLAGETELLRREVSLLKELTSEYENLWHHERRHAAEMTLRAQSLAADAATGKTAAAELEQERASLGELERTLAALQGRLKSEIAQREEETQRAERAEAASKESAEKAKAREAQAEALNVKLTAAQAESVALREQLAQARRAPRNRSDQFNARRRERLKSYRAALRRQVLKLRKASDALGKRMEQVDQMLAQRSELAAARNRILEMERRVQKSKAKSRGAVVSLCAVGVLAILGGLSWAGARELAPAVYMAEVTVKADGRGRELNEAELQEWTRFHMELLNDPMFQEAAAERFQRQGLSALSTASAVTALINNSISADAVQDGEIKLILKGTGQDRTRRTLDAFGASVASFANAAQQRRIDGGATMIPAAARVDDRPIDRSQTIYALAMLAAGTLFASVLALWVWKKLSRVKSSFEHDTHLAAVLDDAHWADPRSQA